MMLTSNVSIPDNCITSQVQNRYNHNIKRIEQGECTEFIFQRIGEEAPGPSVYRFFFYLSSTRRRGGHIRAAESLSPRCLRDGHHDDLLIFRITLV